VTEETERRFVGEFPVDSVDKDAGEADDATDEHCRVHLRLRQLYYAAITVSIVMTLIGLISNNN